MNARSVLFSILLVTAASLLVDEPLRAQLVPPPPVGTQLLGSWRPSFQHPLHTCNPLSPFPQPTAFNTVHTSLIPVDPRRPSNPWGGKVLVFDESSFNSCASANGDWHQRWAIVDPVTQAVQTYTWVIPFADAPRLGTPS